MYQYFLQLMMTCKGLEILGFRLVVLGGGDVAPDRCIDLRS